jgi:competence protein ComEC
LAAAWASLTPQPDIYVAADGQAAAVRGVEGRLSILHRGRDTFAIKEWLAADGDSRLPDDKTLANGTRCDDLGCVGHLRNGSVVALPLTLEAFVDDCAQALVVISAREAPRDRCGALLIDRDVWRERGAMSLRIQGRHIQINEARPVGYQRPWTQPPPRPTATPSDRDATPALNQLEPGD